MTELRRCPFCDGELELVSAWDYLRGPGWFVGGIRHLRPEEGGTCPYGYVLANVHHEVDTDLVPRGMVDDMLRADFNDGCTPEWCDRVMREKAELEKRIEDRRNER